MAKHENDIQPTLERIEMRLNQLEAGSRSENPTNLDLNKVILDSRRERDALFPREYFSYNAWDVLLELYQAHGRGDKLKFDILGRNSQVSRRLVTRYVKMLASDGFVTEQDGDRTLVVLTNKGLKHMESLFQKIGPEPAGTDSFTIEK
ncbi:hypothetical protein [Parasphingorhabdus sp.]|uniref:hypothetical protein n=1 Tax=Parasphingorhabdus sp. TaxID=2709688 RepID=UPI0032633DED